MFCPDSPLLTDPELLAIAEKHDCSPATVLISYQVQRGCIVLPKSVSEARIKSNLVTIELSAEAMKALDGMAAQGKQQRVNTPAFGWDLGFDDWYNEKK